MPLPSDTDFQRHCFGLWAYHLRRPRSREETKGTGPTGSPRIRFPRPEPLSFRKIRARRGRQWICTATRQLMNSLLWQVRLCNAGCFAASRLLPTGHQQHPTQWWQLKMSPDLSNIPQRSKITQLWATSLIWMIFISFSWNLFFW